MNKSLLTVPQPVKRYRPVFLTGNEFLSLPEIDPRTGGLRSLGLLHMASCGLLAFRGAAGCPFLLPWVRVNGKRIGLGSGKQGLSWQYLHEWIPAFTLEEESWQLKGRITVPPGHRGAVYRLNFTNRSPRKVCLELGFKGSWGALTRSVFTSSDLSGTRRVYYDHWTKSLVLEAGDGGGVPLAALSFSVTGENKWQVYARGAGGHTGAGVGAAEMPGMPEVPGMPGLPRAQGAQGSQGAFGMLGVPVTPGAPGAQFDFVSAKKRVLGPGESSQVVLYIAVNRDGDGAGTTQVDLRRHGWAELEAQGEGWLKARFRNLRSPRLTSLLNRNLFFNYFYAQGRTVDTDELALVTSRSPRYYVSAAFWSRDTLLWSFPGLLLLDPGSAREVLVTVFNRHLFRAGEHAHYINGAVLYPGFELDQLAAYVLALKSYLESTGDSGIMAEPVISAGLNTLLFKLFSWQDPGCGLFRTFLDPSDDPVMYPFLIYANALVWCALSFLRGLKEKGLWVPEEEGGEGIGRSLFEEAAQLKEAIYGHGVVPGPRGPMFAWAIDGYGRYQLYDNPPGSLQLLPYYGFCSREDEVYRNTVNWIRSKDNPYFFGEGHIREAASLHAGDPWPLGAANDLLAENRGAETFLHRVSMDNGVACETVHPQSGQARTGLAFATAAGFLAHAIWHRYGQ